MPFFVFDPPVAVGVVAEAIAIVLALVVAPHGRRSSSALAWIVLIITVPALGIILFGLIGSPKLPAARRERQREMNRRIAQAARAIDPVIERFDMPVWLRSIAHLNEQIGALPLVEGREARLLPTFDDQLRALITAADGARSTLHVEFYILALDRRTAPFFAALENARARGVQVRVLLDHLGSAGYPGYRRARAELDRLGVEWHLMLPIQPFRGRYTRPDLRNHRKLLVADDDVAIVGSMNVIDPSYERPKNRRRGLQWRDLMVQVRGTVVAEVQALFITDWYSETDELLGPAEPGQSVGGGDLLCQIAPSGPAFPAENNLALFNSLIYAAERRLSITSPYFVPDESLLGALLTAARRGVAVELFVGAIGDQLFVFHAQHSYYQDLLDAGVRIYRYPAPNILHAKHMTVDDLVGVIGSSNMDIRSFQLDLELSLMVCSRAFTDDLRQIEDGYRAVSNELTLDEWSARSRLHRIGDDLARLTSAVQ